MNTLQKKYKSIAIDKLPSKLKNGLKKLKEKTNNFESDDDKLMKIAEQSLDKVISNLKVKRPELIIKVKGSATKPDTKAPKGKPDPDDTIKERAEKIKKANETKAEAEERAKDEKEEEAEEREDVQEVADSLSQLVKDFPKLKGFNTGSSGRTKSLTRDAGRKASPRGKRVSRKGWKNQYGASKGGRTYYENRENRTDRLAPNYPKGAPKLEKGGKIKAPLYDVVVKWDDSTPWKLVNNEGLTKLEAEKVADAFAKTKESFKQLKIEPALAFEKGGRLNAEYLRPTEILSVVTKDGKVIDYTDDFEFLSGLYISDKPLKKQSENNDEQLSLFEKGGKLPKHAVYIPNYNIDFVETYDDGNIKGNKLYNGIWFKSDKQQKLVDEAVASGRFKKISPKESPRILRGKVPKGVEARIIENTIEKTDKKVYAGLLKITIDGKLALTKYFPATSNSTREDIEKSIRSYLKELKYINKDLRGTNKIVYVKDRAVERIYRFNSNEEAETFEKIIKSIERRKYEKGGLTGSAKSAHTREHKYVNKSEDYEERYAKGKKRERYKKIDGQIKAHKEKKKKKLMADGGYCKRKIYKYGGETGREIFIVNEGTTFDKDKYKAVFQDYDKDGRANIDDKDPLNKKNQGHVEQVELRKSFEKLLDTKEKLDVVMDDVIGDMDKKAPKDAKIYARTKTPYSIIKKLIDKRMTDPKKGLTDLIGTTLVVANRDDLEKIRKTVESGTFGEVIDFDDYYKNPLGGYTAYHYIVVKNGMPVEIQVKTERVKKLNEISHEFYKDGTLSPEGNLKVSKLIEKADKGDKTAQKEVDELFADSERLKDMITVDKKEKGGVVGKAKDRYFGFIDGKRHVVNADSLFDAKNKLIDMLKIPKKKQSLLSVISDKGMKEQEFRFFEKGGKVNRPKSALMRDRKYLNVDEDYEVRYAKGRTKNRKRYLEDGGTLKKYKLGDEYSKDFDYEGMLDYGETIDENTSDEDLKKYAKSLSDVNYHSLARPLNNYFTAISNQSKEFKKWNFINQFKDELRKETEIYKKGGRIKSALMRDRKYLNVDEDYEVRYAKGRTKKRKRYMEEGGKTSKELAKGGEVEFVDTKNPKSPLKIWESRKSKLGQKSIGSFAHRLNGKYVGDYYLYPLDDFDKKELKYIPIKKGEILLRMETDNMLFDEMPLIKVNVDNGRVHFMVEDVDPDNIKFEGASADVIYLSLDKEAKKLAPKFDDRIKPIKKAKKGGLMKRGEVDWANYYLEGGIVNSSMSDEMKRKILDNNGNPKTDPKSIQLLTDYNLSLNQTKDKYYNSTKGEYTPERQKLHKKIINDVKSGLRCIEHEQPIAILMGGSPASGKSTFLKKSAPYLLKDEILKIDADDIRSKLPEYQGWNAPITHRETQDIVRVLLSDRVIGLPCKTDIIYDGTMTSVEKYEKLIKLLKSLGYKIFIVFIDNVPKEEIKRRALNRYKESGRFVPMEVIDSFFKQGKSSLNRIKDDVDGYMVVDGSNDYEVIERGGMKLPSKREYSKLGKPISKVKSKTAKKEKGGSIAKSNEEFADLYGEELMEIMEDIDENKKASKVVPKTDKKAKGGKLNDDDAGFNYTGKMYKVVPKHKKRLKWYEVSPNIVTNKDNLLGLHTKFTALVYDKEKDGHVSSAFKKYKDDYEKWRKKHNI